MLTPAPHSVADLDGRPNFGTFSGALERVDLSVLKGEFQVPRLQRPLKRKRWLYWFVATEEVVLLSAAVDVGYSSNAFALAVDLKRGELLHDSSVLGLPPMVTVSDQPSEGLDARFFAPQLRMQASRAVGAPRFSFRLSAGLPFVAPRVEAKVEMLAAGAPPPLSVVAPVPGGIVNVTQKWASLLSFGTLQAGGRTYRLDGGIGGMDYTHGYLARRTAWRWAFACGRLEDGRPIGFNLVEGFNETRDDVNENALWLDGQVIPLGRARFIWNTSDPLDAWKIRTDDGKLTLSFKPIAAHREERDVVVAKSHFVQPVGLFDGTLLLNGSEQRLRAIPGVTEEQDIVW